MSQPDAGQIKIADFWDLLDRVKQQHPAWVLELQCEICAEPRRRSVRFWVNAQAEGLEGTFTDTVRSLDHLEVDLLQRLADAKRLPTGLDKLREQAEKLGYTLVKSAEVEEPS